MAQLYAVSGQPYRRRDQVSQVNAALPYLSQRLGLKSQQELQDATIADMEAKRKLEEGRFAIEQGRFGLAQGELGLKEKQYALEQKGLGLQERGIGIQEQNLGLQQKGLSQKEQEFLWQQKQAKAAQKYQEDVEQRQMGIKAAGLGFTALTGLGKTTLGDITNKAGALWDNLFNKGATQTAPPVQPEKGTFSSLPLGSMFGGGAVGFGAGQAFGGKNKATKALIGAGVGGLTSLISSGDWSAALGGGILGGLGGLF